MVYDLAMIASVPTLNICQILMRYSQNYSFGITTSTALASFGKIWSTNLLIQRKQKVRKTHSCARVSDTQQVFCTCNQCNPKILALSKFHCLVYVIHKGSSENKLLLKKVFGRSRPIKNPAVKMAKLSKQPSKQSFNTSFGIEIPLLSRKKIQAIKIGGQC